MTDTLAEAAGRLPDGREVIRHVLGNAGRTRLSVLDLGATVQSLQVARGSGPPVEVALGFADPADYLREPADFHGAVVGRYANRIAGGDLPTPGGRHRLVCNEGGNTLHGGPDGFHRRLWQLETADTRSVRLGLTSPDGDQGFPGELRTSVTYTVSDDEVRLDYAATCDAETALNLTNHTYFNLAGEASGSALGHELLVEADQYTPTDAEAIPTGDVRTVTGTPLDFRTLRQVRAPDPDGDRRRHPPGGYDHSFVLRGEGLRRAAVLRDPRSGLTLEVLTDQPGLQVYTGGAFTGDRVGHGGTPYRPGAGIALETQHFPDSPHQPGFPTTLLLPGQRFASTTVWRFGTS